MKHFSRFILIAALALGVGGCAILDTDGRSVLQGGTSITAKIENPVSRNSMAAIELAYNGPAKLEVAYLRLQKCAPGTSIGIMNVCSDPLARREIADAARSAKRAVDYARQFRSYGSVSAVDALRIAGDAVAALKTTLYIHGVK